MYIERTVRIEVQPAQPSESEDMWRSEIAGEIETVEGNLRAVGRGELWR